MNTNVLRCIKFINTWYFKENPNIISEPNKRMLKAYLRNNEDAALKINKLLSGSY